MENPYEWSTDKLLSEFMNASARAGFSNSGMVISFSAGSDLSQAHYLRGVVQARCDQAKPPMKPGDMVSPLHKLTKPRPALRHWDKERKLPKTLTVAVVHYLGEQKWAVTFAERNEATAREGYDDDGDRVHKYLEPLLFNTEDFEALQPAKA